MALLRCGSLTWRVPRQNRFGGIGSGLDLKKSQGPLAEVVLGKWTDKRKIWNKDEQNLSPTHVLVRDRVFRSSVYFEKSFPYYSLSTVHIWIQISLNLQNENLRISKTNTTYKNSVSSKIWYLSPFPPCKIPRFFPISFFSQVSRSKPWKVVLFQWSQWWMWQWPSSAA